MNSVQPSRVSRLLRPVGYLLIALVWTALTLVTIALSGALAAGLGSSGWQPRQMFADVNPVVFSFELAFIAALWAAMVGFLLVLLPLATAPLALLGWTYVGRSLQPGYAREKLSQTRQSSSSIGPATVSGTVAMSLLPVRATPWTDWCLRLYSTGWSPSGSLWFASLPWGVATFLLPGWLLWPVGPVPFVAWTVFTLLALAWTVVLTGRALPHHRGRSRLGASRTGRRAKRSAGLP